MTSTHSPLPLLHWTEQGQPRQAQWRSENGTKPPTRIQVVDDTLNADQAFRLASEGTALLWRGDYHGARQLLQALQRRLERKRKPLAAASLTEAFHQQRMQRVQRARLLGMLLLPIEAGHHLALRRAPAIAPACEAAYGPASEPYVCSLRELLGIIGAWEWRSKGVPVAALDARIHPHYGVFSPVRGEYLDLVARTALPGTDRAFDIGTGTGVLAAILARRGVKQVIATDLDARALDCAHDNLERLHLLDQVTLLQTDLFPQGRAQLIVCNPPWLPARPSSALEHAVYDPDSRMLCGFLQGLAAHLEPGGEGWLILSDLAEHLGLRSRDWLLEVVAQAGLVVVGREDTRPVHSRAGDSDDALYEARSREVTSLWRLAARAPD